LSAIFPEWLQMHLQLAQQWPGVLSIWHVCTLSGAFAGSGVCRTSTNDVFDADSLLSCPAPAAVSGVAGLVMCALPASSGVCCQFATPSNGRVAVSGLIVITSCNLDIVCVAAINLSFLT
jgi:hypothetical protein